MSRTSISLADILAEFAANEAIQTGRLNSQVPNKSNIPKGEPDCGGCSAGHEVNNYDAPDNTALEIITHFDLI